MSEVGRRSIVGGAGVVALVAIVVALLLQSASAGDHSLRRPIESFSFGDESVLYDRGNALVVSTPQIGPADHAVVKVLSVVPKVSGCPAAFQKPKLELASAAAPYLQGYAVPPADGYGPITGVKHQGDLVLRRTGINYAAWYFSWKFVVPDFCRFAVHGYEIRYRTKQGRGTQYVSQLTVFVPTS